MEGHTLDPEQVALCPYCIELAINISADYPKHWQTLALLRSSSTGCTICRILLHRFDTRAKEATDRFKQITESTAEHCPLSLTLINDPTADFEMCHKYIEAGITFPNEFTYVWRFHIATRESEGWSLKLRH